MVFLYNFKCWEIVHCDNLDCLARMEPETPCWEIAKRFESYHNVSNTCRDCAVYILLKETPLLSIGHLKNTEKGHQVCITK